MSSPFRRIYPKTGYILFDGGKNSKFEKALIEDNESPDCANVIFENGSVGTRGGTSKLNAVAIGSFVGDGLYVRRDDTSAETMVAYAGGSAWYWSGTSFVTIGSAQSVFTAGVRVGAAQYENHLFSGNGGVIPYKYNGTDWTRHGIYPPVTTGTIATAPTGTALTGSYSYKFTFVNSQAVESDVGPVTNTMTVANENIRITSIPIGAQSFGVAARRIYRTADAGTTYKRVIELANNTTTTYDDAILDASLGAAAPTDQGVPPNYNVVVYHQNRLFMNDPTNLNYVWYSELENPYVVKATNFIKVGDNTSDLVKGLAVHNDMIVVTCEKSIWLIYMVDTDPTNWKLIRSKSPYGTKSPYCLFDFNNKLGFVAMQNDKLVGFAALSGDGVDPSATLLTVSSAGSDLKSDRIEPDIFDLVENQVGNYSGIVFKNKAYLAVTHESPNTTNNRVYVMDFSMSRTNKNQKESWVPFTGWTPAQFAIFGGSLYFISSTANGFVYKYDETIYNDSGSAIDSYFWTKEFSGYADDTSFHKDFRYINLLVDMAGAYYMNVVYKTDSDLGSGNTTQIDLDPGGSLWGVMVWGTDLWGGGTGQDDHRQFLGGARGKRIQFKFSNQNTVNQRFKVHRANLVYNLKGQR